MKIENILIKNLKPYAKNARKHPQNQIDLLKQNIEKFGFTTPVLIDKENNVIAGHGRIIAMKELDKKEVPCVRMENLTDDEVKALRLADNKIAEMSDWDMELVTLEIDQLDIDLITLIGFDLKQNEPSNLVDELSIKPFKLLCTFKTQEDLENAKVEIQEVLDRYEGSYLSVSGGEL